MIKPVLPNLFDGNPDRDQVEDFVSQHAFPLIDGNAVTFIYVGEAHGVELRHWVYGLPSNLPLQRAGDSDLWFLTMELPEGSRIEYKFGVTRNGHETWEHDSLNPLIAHDPFGGNSVVQCQGYQLPDWTLEDPQSPAGRIERMLVESAAFGDRRSVGLYLPANYRTNRRYRLLIVHDGDDYLKYSQFQFVLDNLMARLEIPPMIVALQQPHRPTGRVYQRCSACSAHCEGTDPSAGTAISADPRFVGALFDGSELWSGCFAGHRMALSPHLRPTLVAVGVLCIHRHRTSQSKFSF